MSLIREGISTRKKRWQMAFFFKKWFFVFSGSVLIRDGLKNEFPDIFAFCPKKTEKKPKKGTIKNGLIANFCLFLNNNRYS